MRKDFFEEFCREFAKEMNRLRMEQRAGLSGAKRELERVKRDDSRRSSRRSWTAFAARGAEGRDGRAPGAEGRAAERSSPRPTNRRRSCTRAWPTSTASKVEELAAALQREDTRLEASEMLRGLIDSIVLTPEEGQLRIELRGNLAAMLTAAQQTKRSPETGDLLVPVQLVAGAGFEPATFGL